MNFDEYVKFLNSQLNILPGIGEKKAALFNKIGIQCVWDLLYTFPHRYENRSVFESIADAAPGQSCCISAVVRSTVIEKKLKNNMSLYILRAEDSTGTINVKWFSSPYNKHNIKRGVLYNFFGLVTGESRSKELVLKDMEIR